MIDILLTVRRRVQGITFEYVEDEDDAQSVIRAVKEAGLDRRIDLRIVNSNRDAPRFDRKFDTNFLNQFELE